MTAKTFTVAGHKIRTTSQRRYVVVIGRETPYAVRRWVSVVDGQPVYEETGEIRAAFKPEIVKRSDNITTARREAASRSVPGGYVYVIDTENDTAV